VAAGGCDFTKRSQNYWLDCQQFYRTTARTFVAMDELLMYWLPIWFSVIAILEFDLENPYITDMTDNREQPMSIVTSAEFQRNLGRYQDKALAEPVIITKNGRERLVLVSVEEYHRLKRRDRRALAVEDLSAEQIAALEKARMPKGHEHLDAELKDWRP
jgi:prevent-host-death family protein